jgi:hypothetical protein
MNYAKKKKKFGKKEKKYGRKICSASSEDILAI